MKFNFLIYLDFIGLIYLGVVLLISSIILIYSVGYIEGDKYINRYKHLLLLFILSICIIIIRPRILRILIG